MQRNLVPVLLLAALLTAPTALGQTWSQENANPLNENTLDRAAPSSLGDHQSTSTGAKILTQIVEGPASTAIAATLDGNVYLVDANGRTLWKTNVQDPIRTAPAWTGEHILILPRGDTAHALNPDGSTAWTLPVENERSSASLVRMASPVNHPSGDVLLATMNGDLHRVNPNGTTQWTYNIGNDQALEATPAILPNGDILIAGFVPGQEGAGTIARINDDTGQPDCDNCWTRTINSQVVGAPTILEDRFLLPLRDGDALQARFLTDGTLDWSVPFNDHVTSSPSLYEELAIVGDIAGLVQAIDVNDGEVDWTFNARNQGQNILSSQTLTVADSTAVDTQGRLWLPYWNADMTTCCPPTDSGSSPIYLLDAATGDIIDSNNFPKAVHGASLHATGVWAGSDEQLLRHWPHGGLLTLYADTKGKEVTLITNTDKTGTWQIQWPDGTTQDGQGKPPALTTHTLPEGTHRIHVTVDNAQASIPVTIDPDPQTQPTNQDNTPNDTPLPALLALLALALTAWRRRRA